MREGTAEEWLKNEKVRAIYSEKAPKWLYAIGLF